MSLVTLTFDVSSALRAAFANWINHKMAQEMRLSLIFWIRELVALRDMLSKQAAMKLSIMEMKKTPFWVCGDQCTIKVVFLNRIARKRALKTWTNCFWVL